MGNEMSAYTAGMVEAQGNNRNNAGDMWGGGAWWIWIILLFFLFAICNNGFGNGNNAGNSGNGGGNVSYVMPYPACGSMGFGASGAMTRNDIYDAFAINNLQRSVDGASKGICDSTYALSNLANANARAQELQLCNGFNGVQQSVNTLGYNLQDCCCKTQNAIQGVKYDMATNTCAIQNTANNNTRDIMQSAHNDIDRVIARLDQIEKARKDDQMQQLREQVQELRLSASQSNQNAVLMAAMDANKAEILRRTGSDCPIAAYVVPNPNCCYGNPVGVNYGNYGGRNNGGCNSGCGSCGC